MAVHSSISRDKEERERGGSVCGSLNHSDAAVSEYEDPVRDFSDATGGVHEARPEVPHEGVEPSQVAQ